MLQRQGAQSPMNDACFAALISEVERGGKKEAPQSYVTIRRGSRRRSQQSYTKDIKVAEKKKAL
jgi:hypothetical protein